MATKKKTQKPTPATNDGVETSARVLDPLIPEDPPAHQPVRWTVVGQALNPQQEYTFPGAPEAELVYPVWTGMVGGYKLDVAASGEVKITAYVPMILAGLVFLVPEPGA